MNPITGASYRNNALFSGMTGLKRNGGTGFGDALQSAYRSGTSPAQDTYAASPAARTKLSGPDLAGLSGRYDPHDMTQEQYDAFLDELVEKGALTREDVSWLGYHGIIRLPIDVDPETGKPTGGFNGWAYVTSLDGSGSPIRPIQSLTDADGDLFRWLDAMLARQDQRIGAATGASARQREALNALSDIVRRM